ncbi:AAA family ATPase [Hyphococcus sp.]|uniref:AAA family ATPase n=1 Tax=Hyphococcus sp. TaxID=2038636 RepID=UPI003CCBE336
MSVIVDEAILPNPTFKSAWDTIKTDSAQKERLIAQSLLALTLRRSFTFEQMPIHGLIVLSGEPGTGKTTLARGLAHKISEALTGHSVNFMQVDAHAMTSASLGKSQKEVTKLFTQTIPERANGKALIVLLDEVETLAADRQRMSLEANPVDVHRATDAALAGADHVARHAPNALLIATTNYPDAVDRAFLSRADLIETMGPPTAEARKAIIQETLDLFGSKWSGIDRLKSHISRFASEAEGLDGRALRKALIAAAASTPTTAMNPGKMTAEQVSHAIKRAHAGRQAKKVAA